METGTAQQQPGLMVEVWKESHGQEQGRREGNAGDGEDIGE